MTPEQFTVDTDNIPLNITQEQLDDALARAVALGRSSGQALPVGQTAIPVDPEPVEEWSVNKLLSSLAQRVNWYSERNERAAYAAINKHFPEPSDVEE